MKEYIKKTLSEIKTGDVKLGNSDYDKIEIEIFDKELFEKSGQSIGISCFGFGSYRGGCSYSLCQPLSAYKYSFIDDEDAAIIINAYRNFLSDEDKLWKEMLEIYGEPLYYVSDSELNIKLDYGDILLYRDLKYEQKSLEFLELQKGDYGYTIEDSIKQEEQFYEWLTSKEDKKMRVVFRGQKIIVAPGYSQCQNGGNSLIISYLSAHEGSLFKVNIDMYELSKRIEKINNGLYKVVRSVFDKYGTVKKEAIHRDWNKNEIKPI